MKIKSKNIFVTLALILMLPLTIIAQNTNEKGVVYLSAEITNPVNDYLIIRQFLHGNRVNVKVFNLVNGVLEKDSVHLEQGFYSIVHGQEHTSCYLKAGYDLLITIDTENFDETVKYKGVGADENNFIANYFMFNEIPRPFMYYNYLETLNEKDFVSFNDSIYTIKKEYLDKNTDKLDDFLVNNEYQAAKFSYLSRIDEYPSLRSGYLNDDDFKVSESYPDAFADFDINNEKYIGVNSYTSFAMNLIRDLTIELIQCDSSNYYISELFVIDSFLTQPQLKEQLTDYFVTYKFVYLTSAELDKCYSMAKEMLLSNKSLKFLETQYKQLKGMMPGAPSPTFEFYDIDSNLVKLHDFKGKFVYIDLWATWCKPCLQEIPHLDTLQEYFAKQDIAFVSICGSCEKEGWENIVRDLDLKGAQLFNENLADDFIKSYKVTFIPRFILLDKEGNIINSNARRPSNSMLKTQLEDLLKE